MPNNYGWTKPSDVPPKYEISGDTTFVSLDFHKAIEIMYAIANELAELNRTMKTVKMSLMNMSQVSSDQYYKRS